MIEHRFAYHEIYPAALGCKDDGRSGMHGTPVGGTTLLHLAIDFYELEIFELLLAHGADVNAKAAIDTDGFGGHTPLFNAVVCSGHSYGWDGNASMTRALLDHGASPAIRANLRKFLDWQEEPAWHEARDVTPAEWGRGFPHQSWVNQEAVRLLSLT